MLRHGMLSPNSKLLPQLEGDPTRLSIMSSASYVSNASNVSLKSTTSTCSKHPKDARDTPQRRVRHRDGRLLKGGIGLTTGLGWSDRLVPSHSLLVGVWFSGGGPTFWTDPLAVGSGDGWNKRTRMETVGLVLLCRGG